MRKKQPSMIKQLKDINHHWFLRFSSSCLLISLMYVYAYKCHKGIIRKMPQLLLMMPSIFFYCFIFVLGTEPRVQATLHVVQTAAELHPSSSTSYFLHTMRIFCYHQKPVENIIFKDVMYALHFVDTASLFLTVPY